MADGSIQDSQPTLTTDSCNKKVSARVSQHPSSGSDANKQGKIKGNNSKVAETSIKIDDRSEARNNFAGTLQNGYAIGITGKAKSCVRSNTLLSSDSNTFNKSSTSSSSTVCSQSDNLASYDSSISRRTDGCGFRSHNLNSSCDIQDIEKAKEKIINSFAKEIISVVDNTASESSCKDIDSEFDSNDTSIVSSRNETTRNCDISDSGKCSDTSKKAVKSSLTSVPVPTGYCQRRSGKGESNVSNFIDNKNDTVSVRGIDQNHEGNGSISSNINADKDSIKDSSSCNNNNNNNNNSKSCSGNISKNTNNNNINNCSTTTGSKSTHSINSSNNSKSNNICSNKSDTEVYSSSPKQSWWQSAAESIKSMARKRSGLSESQVESAESTLNWYISQCISQVNDTSQPNNDPITCLDFSETGLLLAAGDKGGKVTVYRMNQCTDSNSSEKHTDNGRYEVCCSFQSHEREFDFRRTVEIEERINQVLWLKQYNSSNLLLTTNEKIIKLWKISEPPRYKSESNILSPTKPSPLPSCRQGQVNSLHISGYHGQGIGLSEPWWRKAGRKTLITSRRAYHMVHEYNIHSLSTNSDLETFLSADDLRINLWHLDVTENCFNIVDMKPSNIEDLSEVITSAQFHPTECNLFAYGSSKGSIRLCDMRSRALCDKHYKLLEDQNADSSKNYFSEIICSILDIRFPARGHYLMSRDYMTLKIWDIRSEGHGPVEVIPVQEHLRARLTSLYETEAIFDRFQCAWSPDNRYVLSGSYSNFFKLYDRKIKQGLVLQADLNQPHHHHNQQSLPHKPQDQQQSLSHKTQDQQLMVPRKISSSDKRFRRPANEISSKEMDFGKKLLSLSWHPKDDLIASASGRDIFVIVGKQIR